MTISLGEAVKIYGNMYRYEICGTALMANHKISLADAKKIEAAVRRILPRRS